MLKIRTLLKVSDPLFKEGIGPEKNVCAGRLSSSSRRLEASLRDSDPDPIMCVMVALGRKTLQIMQLVISLAVESLIRMTWAFVFFMSVVPGISNICSVVFVLVAGVEAILSGLS